MSDELPIFGRPRLSVEEVLSLGLARKLRDHIETMGWTVKGAARWQKAFVLLMKTYGVVEVRNRLNAYIDLKIDRPKVHNGDDFRANWVWIGEQIEKARLTAAPPELCPDTKHVLRLLAANCGQWPARATMQLAGALSQSVKAYTEFRTRLRTVAFDDTDDRLRKYLLGQMPAPADYLYTWFRDVYERLCDFDGWTGDLAAQVWTPTHERFTREMDRLCSERGEPAGAWEKLLKKVMS